MMTYIATTHSIWARVMGLSPSTHCVGFADDCFLKDDLPQVLRTIADPIQSFRTHADLEMQPTKLKIHIKGVPVGSPEFIANYVRSKALDIVQDVAKLRIMEDDPLVHSHLVKICQHTRLACMAGPGTCPQHK